MSYFIKRPICGANLDPDEKCDCECSGIKEDKEIKEENKHENNINL